MPNCEEQLQELRRRAAILNSRYAAVGADLYEIQYLEAKAEAEAEVGATGEDDLERANHLKSSVKSHELQIQKELAELKSLKDAYAQHCTDHETTNA